jgi:hypothetical protein
MEGFGLSFLDVICCGFGAIVLLLVLTKIGEPAAIEQSRVELDKLIKRLEEEIYEIRGETNILNRQLISKQEQLSIENEKIARLRGDLSRIRGEFASSAEESEIADILEGRMVAAQQELTQEMLRLQAQQSARLPSADNLVGGIPVDSEYIIFIVDTSGSMQSYAWNLMLEKMTQVLDAHPKVKGLQIMNDMGQYMFSQYAGKWIPDTPSRRRVILSNHPHLRGIRQEDQHLCPRRRVQRQIDRRRGAYRGPLQRPGQRRQPPGPHPRHRFPDDLLSGWRRRLHRRSVRHPDAHPLRAQWWDVCGVKQSAVVDMLPSEVAAGASGRVQSGWNAPYLCGSRRRAGPDRSHAPTRTGGGLRALRRLRGSPFLPPRYLSAARPVRARRVHAANP